jgi:hypothetical protein
MRIVAGPPIDLSSFRGQQMTPSMLKKATALVMDTLTTLLAGLRGERPPAEPFDPSKANLPTTGNPHKRRRVR